MFYSSGLWHATSMAKLSSHVHGSFPFPVDSFSSVCFGAPTRVSAVQSQCAPCGKPFLDRSEGSSCRGCFEHGEFYSTRGLSGVVIRPGIGEKWGLTCGVQWVFLEGLLKCSIFLQLHMPYILCFHHVVNKGTFQVLQIRHVTSACTKPCPNPQWQYA